MTQNLDRTVAADNAAKFSVISSMSISDKRPFGDFPGLSLGNLACTTIGTDTYRCGSAITVAELQSSTSLSVWINNVPAPASLAMLATTLDGLFWSRRHRRTA